MDIMSYMWKQDKVENQGRYRAKKLSSILPEVQTKSTNQY